MKKEIKKEKKSRRGQRRDGLENQTLTSLAIHLGLGVTALASNLTEHFTILKPNNPEIGDFYFVKKRHSTD